jgi:type VI secretion system protein ImpM
VTGYFGKVSTHGDFVKRGLPDALVAAWDTWLQACIQASRDQLGEHWLNRYLTSPVWRFAIAPGVLGPEGLGGVMMPSVDRVGRYFPLMIAATGALPLMDWLQKQGAWFDALEDLARQSLDAAFHLTDFDLAPKPTLAPSPPVAPGQEYWRFALDGDVVESIAMATLQRHSLWWSEGAPVVEGSLLVCAGLPPPRAFAAMLDGSWAGSGWQVTAA